MANTHTTLTSLFTDIANTIREKTGEKDAIVADNFPSAIEAIHTMDEVEPEVTTYENLLQTAIANLQGKAVPAPVVINEGEYVWKKTIGGVIEFTQLTTNANPTIFQASSERVDLSKLTIEDFYDYKGTMTSSSNTYYITIDENGYKDTSDSVYYTVTYDATTAQLKLGVKFSSSYTWSDYDTTEIINYVVSDDEAAYPDGAEQDGYWYDRVSEGLTPEMFGCTKMAVDTITFSSRVVASQTNLTHTLGGVPLIAILIRDGRATVSSELNMACGINLNKALNVNTTNTCVTAYSYGSSISYSAPRFNCISNNEIKFDLVGVYYSAGVEYTLITMV